MVKDIVTKEVKKGFEGGEIQDRNRNTLGYVNDDGVMQEYSWIYH